MIEILVGCETGCRVFTEARELPLELAGKSVGPIAAGAEGGCIAVIDQKEIWQRSADRNWSKLAALDRGIQSILHLNGTLLGGGLDVPPLKRSPAGGVGSVNSRLSVQQTQKSFSMTAGIMFRCLAAA